jgi:WD40 repeat protein
MSLAFSHDSRTVAASLVDGQVDVFGGADYWRLSGGNGIARTLAFSSTDEQLLVGYDSGQIYAWDWRRQQRITVLEGHSAPIKCMLISMDGTRVVSSSDDGTVKIWDGRTFQEIVTFPESERSIEVVAFSPDSRFLAAAGDDRRIQLWDGSRLP